MYGHLFYLFLAFASVTSCIRLQVAGSGGNTSSPIQYGLIFEDISHSGDGGIYAELIQNRAFQAFNFSSATVDPWVSMNGAKLAVQDKTPLSDSLPFSIKVSKGSSKAKQIGMANPGWWGIDVRPQKYTGSFYMRGSYNGKIIAALKSNTTSKTLASTSIPVTSSKSKWKQFHFTLTPKRAAKDTSNYLSITFSSAKATDGSLSFNLLSLFPPTYNDRPNGMRIDLMDALAETYPKFLRFPGGNNLEGNGLSQNSPRWIWNNTIGPLKDRPGRFGTWSYYNTDGIGLNEYLEWCEDLKMEPLLAVWAGHYLDGTNVAEDELQPYVQEALDQLEYLMGSKNTKFGALRASHGYPKPWKVKYVEVGNEDNLSDGLDTYKDYRFQAFYDAIHAKYPDIIVIASTTDITIPEGAGGDYHTYTTPDTLVTDFTLFDNATTKSYIIAGEYSAQTPNGGSSAAQAPFWIGSVAEAIYNLGLERNSGKVLGSTYAPILQNRNEGAYQWTPNLVTFNANPDETVATTSVKALGLYAANPITSTREVQSSEVNGGDSGVFWAAGYDADSSAYVLKMAVYNSTDGADVPMRVRFGDGNAASKAQLTVLSAGDPYAFVEPAKQSPVEESGSVLTAGPKGYFNFALPDLSVAVLKSM